MTTDLNAKEEFSKIIRDLENASQEALTIGQDKRFIEEHCQLSRKDIEQIYYKGTSSDRAVLEAESRIDMLTSVVSEQVKGLKRLAGSL